MVKSGALLFLALCFGACAPAVQGSTPVPSPTASRAAGPHASPAPYKSATTAPTVTLPTSLPRTTAEVPRRTFSDETIGVSAVYPPNWEMLPRTPDDPPGFTLHGPPLGNGPEPIIFAITVEAEPVNGSTVDQIVDQQLEQVPAGLSGRIARRTVVVGGQRADQVIGLPSQGGALETFVIHRGRLFLIILQPYDESNESLQPYLPQVRSLYGDFISSWEFLN
jgi:hypothetical protein